MPITKRTKPLFRLTNSTTVTIKRPGEITYVNGRKVVGEPTEHEIEANIQPLKFREVLLLPEADRTKEWIKGYCTLEQNIRAMKEGENAYESDVVVWGDYEYKVMKVLRYEMGVLDHICFHAARLPISAGGG